MGGLLYLVQRGGDWRGHSPPRPLLAVPLDDESAAILVHAFVTSRVDYCNLLLAGSPKSVTDKLQRVMNAAARVVSGTKKYDRGLTHLLYSELH